MNILATTVELENTKNPADVHVLADRIDEMHDVLTADPTVLSADIAVDGGSKISIFLRVVSSGEEETKDEAEQRVDALCERAFEAAQINVTERVESADRAEKREFALV